MLSGGGELGLHVHENSGSPEIELGHRDRSLLLALYTQKSMAIFFVVKSVDQSAIGFFKNPSAIGRLLNSDGRGGRGHFEDKSYSL